MKRRINKKYDIIVSVETRSINESIKASKIELKGHEKKLNDLNKKINKYNKLVSTVTKAILQNKQKVNSSAALITTNETKLNAAKKSGSETAPKFFKQIQNLKRSWKRLRNNQNKLQKKKVLLVSTLKKYQAEAKQVNNQIKQVTNAIKTYQAQGYEIKKKIASEKAEDIHHRTLYLNAQEQNVKLNKESRKIENELGQMTGNTRKNAHLRLNRIKNLISKNNKIIKVEKEYISVNDEKQNNLKGIMKKIGAENKKHSLYLKKNSKALTNLKKLISQWKKEKNGLKKVYKLTKQADEVENKVDNENDRHESQLDEFVKNTYFFRINSIKKEIKLLKKEKKVLKSVSKVMKEKRCSVNNKAPAAIKKTMKAEQDELKRKIKKAVNRIKSIKSRISGLKFEKDKLRKELKEISIKRVKESNDALKLQRIKVSNFTKIIKKLSKSKKVKDQEEYKRMIIKLQRSTQRMNALREIRDSAERDRRTIRFEELRELREKQGIMKHFVRQLTYRRMKLNRLEKRNVAKMALLSGDCSMRKQVFKKLRKIQAEKKTVTKQLDKFTKKFIEISQRIHREEENMMKQLRDENDQLVQKKIAIEKKIQSIKQGLKKQNNEKAFHEELGKIEDMKNDIKSLDSRITSIRSEIRRTSASLLMRKHEEQYKKKSAIYVENKKRLFKLRRSIAKLTKKIMEQQDVYEKTVVEAREPIDLRIKAMKTDKENKEKKAEQLVKIVEELEQEKIREAYRVIDFLKATISDTEQSKKEYMKIAGKKSSQFKAQYDYLAQIANNDIVRMKKAVHEYEGKVHEFRNKLVEYVGDKVPNKICIELGKRAKEALVMNMDNAQLLRTIEDRCKSFPETERGKCYTMAFKISKYVSNLFDPQELNVKNMCIVLKGC